MALRYVALAAALAAPTDPPDTENQPFWTGHPDAPAFERAVDTRLDHARNLLARLVGVKGKRTVSNTLEPYDRLMRELDRAASASGLIQKVHPDSALRQAADRRDMLAAEPALRYRSMILERGGSAPAARLVEDFLGRPFSFDTWRRWLEDAR